MRQWERQARCGTLLRYVDHGGFWIWWYGSCEKKLKYLEEKHDVQNKHSGLFIKLNTALREVLWEQAIKYTAFSVFWGYLCFISFIGMEYRPDIQKLCSHLLVNICKKFSLDMNCNSISIIYKENLLFSLLPGQNFVKSFTHQANGNYFECYTC